MSAAQPDEPLPDDTQQPTPAPASEGRADWLVGADEGLAAEMARGEADAVALPRPTLLRPVSPDAPAAVTPPVLSSPASRLASVPPPAPVVPLAATRRPGMVEPETDSHDDGFERGPGGMRWEPGTRSVPSLQREAPVSIVPAPTHDFPMDDAEERALMSAAELAAAAADAERPHAVVSPEAFEVAVVPVPWWMQGVHVLRSDRRVQLLLGLVLVALTVVAMWPRGERPVSISNLRRHATSFDGVDVKVEGRVGQVFQVGGGYAFYLQDGRDTLVVFSRSRVPHERQHVKVKGTMSTGFLDGRATLALFESAETK